MNFVSVWNDQNGVFWGATAQGVVYQWVASPMAKGAWIIFIQP